MERIVRLNESEVKNALCLYLKANDITAAEITLTYCGSPIKGMTGADVLLEDEPQQQADATPVYPLRSEVYFGDRDKGYMNLAREAHSQDYRFVEWDGYVFDGKSDMVCNTDQLREDEKSPSNAPAGE
jgi:hypothetical protein